MCRLIECDLAGHHGMDHPTYELRHCWLAPWGKASWHTLALNR